MAPRKTKAPADAAEPTPKPPTPAVKAAKPAKAAARKAVVPPPVPAPEPEAAPKKKKSARVAVTVLPVPLIEAPKPVRGRKPKPAPPEAPGEAPEAAAATAGGAPRDAFVPSLLDALRAGRAVELVFKDAAAYAPRTFEPRSLAFDTLSQAWYVWGWDRRYNAERHHCLDLLAEVNPVDGVGRAAQGPYPEGTPANLIGGWLGGEPIPVKALLFKQWIFAVRQAPPPFPDFKVVDLEDGKAQVSFTGTDLRAIARWCMQFGEGIQVQEPQRLVDRFKQVGVTWSGKPAPAPPPPPKAAPKPEAPRAEARHRAHEPRPESRTESRTETKGKAPKVEVRQERL